MNSEQRIQETISIFVQDLRTLLAQATKERLLFALGEAAAVGDAAREGIAPARAPRPRAAAPKAAPQSGRRVRRNAEQLAEVQEQILAVLNKTSGLTSEQLQEAVGLQKQELQRPLQLLRDDHKIRTTGQKRAMRYFPGAGKAGVVRRRNKAAE